MYDTAEKIKKTEISLERSSELLSSEFSAPATRLRDLKGPMRLLSDYEKSQRIHTRTILRFFFFFCVEISLFETKAEYE